MRNAAHLQICWGRSCVGDRAGTGSIRARPAGGSRLDPIIEIARQHRDKGGGEQNDLRFDSSSF
jgi:hypothetical protein